MLITHTQVDELLSTLTHLSGLDEELAATCAPLIRAERYDEAVSRAFVILEERLRGLLGVRGGAGVHLASKAFNSKSGEFVDRIGRPAAEVEGIRDLFVGAFRAYRNRAAHTVAGYSLQEAQGIIHLVNLLLLVLHQVGQAPTESVPEKVSQALGPDATRRLRLFLDRLKQIGIERGTGKNMIPYKATLEYKASSWPSSRPNLVTLFYLTREDVDPQIHFHTYGLSRVVGVDMDRLESDLIQLGCRRTGLRSRALSLPLSDHNDQETFDRLFEILEDVLESHGG
jgi:uncharacterized protein (TIGR02391 family)